MENAAPQTGQGVKGFCGRTTEVRLHSDRVRLNIPNWVRLLVIPVLCVFPLHFAFSGEPGFDATLNVTGGAHRMFRKGIDQPVLEIDAWSKDSTNHDVTASLQVFDMVNRPEAGAPRPITLHLPADGSKLSLR